MINLHINFSQFGSVLSPIDLIDDNNSVDALRALSSLVENKLDDEEINLTWDEIQKNEKLKREHKEAAHERANIQTDFEKLKKRVCIKFNFHEKKN